MTLSNSIPCRVLIEPEPQPGSWNMAVDETLLQSAIEQQQCTLRWYRWSEPTLSLGYFQPAAELEEHEALKALPCVRRLSGGGAILHHHEWTYSCALPANHPATRDPYSLYKIIHRAIIQSLAQIEIRACLREEERHSKSTNTQFLCFARGDETDIVFQSHKIMGSAQRRRKGAVLQHGSLVLENSEFAPQFPGLLDLTELNTFPFESIQHCSSLITAGLQTSYSMGDFTQKEKLATQKLELSKYNSTEWNQRKST